MAISALFVVMAVGLIAGYVAALIGRGGVVQRRAAYLGLGLLGAVAGDWLLVDLLAVFPPVSMLGHVLAALAGATALLALAGLFRRLFA